MCCSVIDCVLPGTCFGDVSGAGGGVPAGRWTGVFGTPYAHAGDSGVCWAAGSIASARQSAAVTAGTMRMTPYLINSTRSKRSAGGWAIPAASSAHRHDPLDVIVGPARARGDDAGAAEVAPAEPPVHAVRPEPHAARGALHPHLDEALEERGDVVVEQRRQILARERPGVEPARPPPRGPLPP